MEPPQVLETTLAGAFVILGGSIKMSGHGTDQPHDEQTGTLSP